MLESWNKPYVFISKMFLRTLLQRKRGAESVPEQERIPVSDRQIVGHAEPSEDLLPIDEITTVSEKIEGPDPLLERIKALKIAKPMLKSRPTTESSLTDILVRKPSASSSSPSNISGTLNPNVLLELFSTYREWQSEKAREIAQKQEEIENKIDTADALAGKLLQRFNYSASSMRTTANSLAKVHQLQIEAGELKGRLTEIISNCDALCKRIEGEGPASLGASVVPFSARGATSTDCFSS